MEWRPIETVPAREEVLVFCEEQGIVIGCLDIEVGKIYLTAVFDTVDEYHWVEKPTHWIPLPQPPEVIK